MSRRVSVLFVLMLGCNAESDPLPESYQDMTFEQRQQYMTETVLPTMKAEFEAVDASYSSMNCATCHGDGATDGTFSMPNGGLAALDVNAWPTDPPVDFMTNTVVPTMADLLDEDPFDASTGEGFGCFGCHPAP